MKLGSGRGVLNGTNTKVSSYSLTVHTGCLVIIKLFCALLTFNVSPNFASQITKLRKRMYLMEFTTLLVISSTHLFQKNYDEKVCA